LSQLRTLTSFPQLGPTDTKLIPNSRSLLQRHGFCCISVQLVSLADFAICLKSQAKQGFSALLAVVTLR